jgi:hypothetical protein
LPGLHESLLTCAETAAARLRISTDELVEMSTKKDQRPAERAATHAAYVSWKHAQALHDRLITVKPWLERLAWFAGLDPNRSVTRARVFEMVDKAQAGLQKALSETEQGHPGRQGLVDASLRLEPYWRGLDPLIKAASRSDGAASNAFLSEAISQCRATLADVKTGVGWHRLSPPVEPVPVDPTG